MASSETPPSTEVPLNGTHSTKRARMEYEASDVNATHSVHRNTSPHTLAQANMPGQRQDSPVYFEDDCHPDYEFIRIPKKRDYDLFYVARRKPEERSVDKAEIPLTATKHDGTNVILWAKMDTGAEVNLINMSTVAALLGEHASLRTMTIAERQKFGMINNTFFEATHSVNLDFIAGASEKQFSRVNFIVIPDDEEQSRQDGVPNVLLGQPFLREHSMLMIDIDYCHNPDDSLLVLAERASKERPDSDGHGILPIVKLPNKPGVQRPRPMR